MEILLYIYKIHKGQQEKQIKVIFYYFFDSMICINEIDLHAVFYIREKYTIILLHEYLIIHFID